MALSNARRCSGCVLMSTSMRSRNVPSTGFDLPGAHGLDVDPATRLGAVANPVTFAELQMLAHTARHRHLVTAPRPEGRGFLLQAAAGAVSTSRKPLSFQEHGQPFGLATGQNQMRVKRSPLDAEVVTIGMLNL